jgi:ABC-type transport system involved in multi-copper enzyme maturation permease subunit
MIPSLIWKESREHLWKIAAVFVLFAPLALTAHYARGSVAEDTAVVMSVAAAWMLPVWMAAGTVVSEKIRRTEQLLFALPIRRWKIWTIKTLVGLLTILLPIVAFMLLLGWLDPRNGFSRFEVIGTSLGLANVYIMTVTLARKARREATVAIFGVLLLLGLALYTVIVDPYVRYADEPGRVWPWLLLAPNPFSFLRYRGDNALLVAQFVVAAIWWTAGLFLYTRPESHWRISTPAPSPEAAPPLKAARSMAGTLLWRELRDQGVILAGAALAGTLIALIVGLSELHDRPITVERLKVVADSFSQTMFSLAAVVPLVVAVLLGVASWSTDLHSKVHEFWRSRPIPTENLFWLKFIVSAVGIIGLFTSFMLVSYAFELWQPSSGSALVSRRFTNLLLTRLAILPAMLAVSIFIAIIVRRTMYAGLVAAATMIATAVAAEILTRSNNQTGTTLLHAVLLTSAAVFLFLSRTALIKNWRLITSPTQ